MLPCDIFIDQSLPRGRLYSGLTRIFGCTANPVSCWSRTSRSCGCPKPPGCEEPSLWWTLVKKITEIVSDADLINLTASPCELRTVLWPAVVSWHLSNDHRNSTAWPRSFTCSSISLSFVRTCGEGRGAKTWSWHLQMKINEWQNHHNGRIQKSISLLFCTCCVKAVFPPGIGKLDGAMGRRSRGEPVLFLLSVRE